MTTEATRIKLPLGKNKKVIKSTARKKPPTTKATTKPKRKPIRRKARRPGLSDLEYSHALVAVGGGASSQDIANMLGDTSKDYIRKMMSRLGIKFVAKHCGEKGLAIVVSKSAYVAGEKFAAAKHVELRWMAGKVLDAALHDEYLLKDLLKEAGVR
jgi:hypothetical protein